MVYRFGAFELDADTGQLLKSGVRIKLAGQPLEVLTLLARRQGELVTREELKDALWKEETFTDFDHGVNTAIQRIRRALGDSAQSPRFVETLPRKGYRFLASVESPEASRTPNVSWKPWTVAAVLLVFALVAWRLAKKPAPAAPGLASQPAIPVTTYPGSEFYATFSPDNSQMAFQWNGPNQNNDDIYVKVIGDDRAAQRLTKDPSADTSPRWSADGKWIAFLRTNPAGAAELMIISPRGGPPRRVAETMGPQYPYLGTGPYLSWTPNDEAIVVVDRPGPGSPFHLTWVDVATGTKRHLTKPPSQSVGDTGPAVSRDGKQLAFSRLGDMPFVSLNLVEIRPDGKIAEARHLSTETPRNHAPAWTGRPGELVFTGSSFFGFHSSSRIYSMDVNSGVSGAGAYSRVRYPTVSQDGRLLAFTQGSTTNHIYSLDLTSQRLELKPVLRSTLGEFDAQYSPDGTQIGYISRKSGKPEIWVSDQSTGDEFPVAQGSGHFSWSPDGKRLVVQRNLENTPRIVVTDVAPDALAPDAEPLAKGSSPYWSRHGRGIYFDTAAGNEESQIFRVNETGGPPKQLTFEGGANPVESPDGRYVYYTLKRGLGIPLKRVPSDGGKEETMVDAVYMGVAFTVVDGGLYYATPPDELGRVTLRFRDLKSGLDRELMPLQVEGWLDMSPSPDGKNLLITQSENTADIMMVEIAP